MICVPVGSVGSGRLGGHGGTPPAELYERDAVSTRHLRNCSTKSVKPVRTVTREAAGSTPPRLPPRRSTNARSAAERYIDEYEERFGIDPSAEVLTEASAGIAPSTSARRSRPPSVRAVGDLVLGVESPADLVGDEVETVWRQLDREGIAVPRCRDPGVRR